MSLTHLTVAAGLAWALATPPAAQAQEGAQTASPLQAGTLASWVCPGTAQP